MFLSTQDLLYAFQCCSPQHKNERTCSNCPLYNDESCHETLCSEAVEYILSEQGKSERFARGVDAVVDSVNNLHALY